MKRFKAVFAGFNILDNILATGEYFNRFCSCGIEKKNRSCTAQHSAVDLASHDEATSCLTGILLTKLSESA